MKKGKLLAAAAVLPLAANSLAIPFAKQNISSADGQILVEYLNRGISAVNTGSGMMVSWRFNANDADNATFRLYRNSELIYESTEGKATSFLDKSGNANSQYRVDCVENDRVVSSEVCTNISNTNYLSVPMDVPWGGSDYSYVASDTSVGDVDGDGTYELFVKWDPTNAQDNSKDGYTGNVYIDCYKLDGQKLWRIDLGRNIRAGAHPRLRVQVFDKHTLEGNKRNGGLLQDSRDSVHDRLLSDAADNRPFHGFPTDLCVFVRQRDAAAFRVKRQLKLMAGFQNINKPRLIRGGQLGHIGT